MSPKHSFLFDVLQFQKCLLILNALWVRLLFTYIWLKYSKQFFQIIWFIRYTTFTKLVNVKKERSVFHSKRIDELYDDERSDVFVLILSNSVF